MKVTWWFNIVFNLFNAISVTHTLGVRSSFLTEVFSMPKSKTKRSPLTSININDSSEGLCKKKKKDKTKRRPNKTVFSSLPQQRYNSVKKRSASTTFDTPSKKQDQRNTPPRIVSVKSPHRKVTQAQVRGQKRSRHLKPTRGSTTSSHNTLLTLISTLIPVHMASTPKACC